MSNNINVFYKHEKIPDMNLFYFIRSNSPRSSIFSCFILVKTLTSTNLTFSSPAKFSLRMLSIEKFENKDLFNVEHLCFANWFLVLRLSVKKYNKVINILSIEQKFYYSSYFECLLYPSGGLPPTGWYWGETFLIEILR